MQIGGARDHFASGPYGDGDDRDRMCRVAFARPAECDPFLPDNARNAAPALAGTSRDAWFDRRVSIC
ncbi:MAG TPA: hypothetical protein VEA16_01760 [Vicinamibacterales bacterium]|nr:hypothetical protein [Vicinamibacterales bacterium]